MFATVRQPGVAGGSRGPARCATARAGWAINPRRKDERSGGEQNRAQTAAAAPGLSIVVPLYNEAASLARVHAGLIEVARTLGAERSLACEVVYVDDGSGDDTLAIARALPANALDVQLVSLSRNFGKEAALLAGLDHARLGAVLFIDGDGQHPPALIETLVGHWLDDGYDVVYTAKAHRANEIAFAAHRGEDVLSARQLRRAQQDTGGCRRLSPALAARGRRTAPAAGAQPLLQGTVELDRLPPDPHRL